jgi:glycosyltransferase involved in cell wall biosynthesis
MATTQPRKNLFVCTPHLREQQGADNEEQVASLLRRFLWQERVAAPVVWIYSPMMLPWVTGLDRSVLVYDCMDELSLFLNAPQQLLAREDALLKQADLVFTGGESLYAAKRARHPRVYAFPNSVDVTHFRVASDTLEPGDQSGIPRPRIGFFGVIDERIDLELLRRAAAERPNYHFVMLGPVVKISPDSLPFAHNIHYLGAKPYAELPAYAAGWDVAIMPFALNDATRFISPTKTLEYLAAGKPIVSTAIRDVVRPYAELGVVRIADAETFAPALDAALGSQTSEQLNHAEGVLLSTSWDMTWSRMSKLIDDVEVNKVPKQAEETCSTI